MGHGINKAVIVGNVGQDPEIRYTQDGKPVANLSLATSESWNDKNTGERREKTEWHRVVIFGKLAEIAGQYVTKGRQVYIEGKLQTRKWQGQDGQNRYTTEIVVQGFGGTMQLLGNRNGNSDQSYADNRGNGSGQGQGYSHSGNGGQSGNGTQARSGNNGNGNNAGPGYRQPQNQPSGPNPGHTDNGGTHAGPQGGGYGGNGNGETMPPPHMTDQGQGRGPGLGWQEDDIPF